MPQTDTAIDISQIYRATFADKYDHKQGFLTVTGGYKGHDSVTVFCADGVRPEDAASGISLTSEQAEHLGIALIRAAKATLDANLL